MSRRSKGLTPLALLLLMSGALAATARMLQQPNPDLSIPGEGLCTTLCKWNRQALVDYVDPEYGGLTVLECMKLCRKTAAVVNPGQCRFYGCTATRIKYATQARCRAACAANCVALWKVLFQAASPQECTRLVASSNPGKGRP